MKAMGTDDKPPVRSAMGTAHRALELTGADSAAWSPLKDQSRDSPTMASQAIRAASCWAAFLVPPLPGP